MPTIGSWWSARGPTAPSARRGSKAARPKTFEDLLNYGVVLHNRGDFPEAVKYLQPGARDPPRNEHALYCMAAAQARAGDSQAAIKALKSAIHANPANRAQARRDSDFEALREEAEFAPSSSRRRAYTRAPGRSRDRVLGSPGIMRGPQALVVHGHG